MKPKQGEPNDGNRESTAPLDCHPAQKGSILDYKIPIVNVEVITNALNTFVSAFPIPVGFNFSDEPKPTVENAGIRTGEIVGYRAWLIDDDWLLRSVYMSKTVWIPGEVMKMKAEKITPDWGPGIHAFKTLDQVKDSYACKLPYGDHIGKAFGEVELWGEVIEFEQGWKAQYAAIRSIIEVHTNRSWFPSLLTQKAQRLKELYESH